MLAKIVPSLAALIVGTISTLGYGGIVILMAIESACVPLPSEIIMPFSGYLVFTGRFDLVLVATMGAIGCNVGSTIAYAVGYYGGRRFIEHWGGYVLMGRRELDWTHRFFERYGSITVLVGRLLPIIRTFIALPAGIAGMSQTKFQIYTFIGSWPWCYALAYVGYRLGEQWDNNPHFKAIMQQSDVAVAAAIVLGIVWYIWWHVKHRLRPDE
ncbi:MAG: DedA family protein [Alphaproteobacteria bacterium]|nr:DedA family protein [Alphaproteobacteria bacterium]